MPNNAPLVTTNVTYNPRRIDGDTAMFRAASADGTTPSHHLPTVSIRVRDFLNGAAAKGVVKVATPEIGIVDGENAVVGQNLADVSLVFSPKGSQASRESVLDELIALLQNSTVRASLVGPENFW